MVNVWRHTQLTSKHDQTIAQMCSVKKVSWKFRKIFTKMSLFLIKLQASSKKTLVQVLSYVFCEIVKNTVFYSTQPVAASDDKYFTFIYIACNHKSSFNLRFMIDDSWFMQSLSPKYWQYWSFSLDGTLDGKRWMTFIVVTLHVVGVTLKIKSQRFWLLIFEILQAAFFEKEDMHVLVKDARGTEVFQTQKIFFFQITSESWRKHLISMVLGQTVFTMHKKWSFPFRISWVNVTKSPVSCGFGHIY